MSTQVTRVSEGAETTIFIQQFTTWPSPQSSPNYATKAGKNVAGKIDQKAIDFGKLHAPGAPPSQKMVDDGSGKIKLWKIVNFEKQEVTDEKSFGQFYQGDSYILLYTYKDTNGKEFNIVYYWQGLDSTQDEKGASALHAKGLDDELGGLATVVRVVQNKEPDHFLALFKGRFVIHSGGVASGFKNSDQKDTSQLEDVRMYNVHGTNVYNTKATQVKLSATSLNSTDAFVVIQKGKTSFVWFGKGATGDERNMAKAVAERMAPPGSVETVFEGSEKNDFWAAVGGKAEYMSMAVSEETVTEPRLFEMSNASGAFTVEEVYNFDQTDLISEDVYLLDCKSEIWLWVGVDSNEIEKKSSMEAALQFLKSDSTRDQSTPIILVKQGAEAPLFKSYFIGWDDAKSTSSVKDYEKLKASLQAGTSTVSISEQLKKYSATYPYATLLERPLPDGVDAANLENHLNTDEFPKVFGKTKDEFFKLPKWKQTEAKKQKKLY